MAMTRVKVTVIRKVDMKAIHPGEDMGSAESMESTCPLFTIGQEFIIEGGDVPRGFCPGAFADIYRYISGLRAGANYSWMKKPGTAVACCTDGLRPVIFRIERM